MSLDRDRLLAAASKALDSPGLRLEAITALHARALFSDLLDSNLYTYIPENEPASPDELELRYARWSNRGAHKHNEVWFNYAVWSAEEGSYVGTLQATVQCDEAVASIAYMIFPKFWKRGFGGRACQRMMEQLRTLGLRRFEANVDTRNINSQALLRSLGFSRTGHIEAADEFKGSVSDEYVYRLDVEAPD